MGRSLASLIAGFALLASLDVAGQQPPPVFKSGVDTVEIDAVVQDKKGQPVRGLTRVDFAVREDGKPVSIDSFAELDTDDTATPGDARFVVLLLDDGTAPMNSIYVKRIARRFAEHMTDRDSVAVRRVNGDGVTSPMSHQQVVAAIDAFQAVGPGLLSPAARVKHVFETIGEVARQMSPIAHRRKTLVFIGAADYIVPAMSGGLTRLSDLSDQGNPNAAPYWFGADTLTARTNVSVYGLDPDIHFDPRRMGSFDRETSGFASETGGQLFVGAQVFDSAVDQIWKEAGHYYVIGYATPASGSKRAHTISVRVSKSGMTVNARRTRSD